MNDSFDKKTPENELIKLLHPEKRSLIICDLSNKDCLGLNKKSLYSLDI